MLKPTILFIAYALTNLTIPHPQDAENVKFQTIDGLSIAATFLKSNVDNAKSPAIVFIHQGGSSRGEWIDNPLWKQLAAQGYALLAYDVRMHGESEKDSGSMMDLFNNPNRSPTDLKAAIKFLRDQESIDADRVAIVGASIGGNLACVASADPKLGIKSAVSLSAKTSAVQNLSGSQKPIAPKNVFHIASEKEQTGLRKKWAKELHTKTTGKRKITIANGSKHGSFILAESPALVTEIVSWLKDTL